MEGEKRRQREEGEADEDGAGAGAEKIGAIDPPRMLPEGGEGEADGGAGGKEGEGEEEIDEQQPDRLPRIPEDLQGIEGETLGEENA